MYREKKPDQLVQSLNRAIDIIEKMVSANQGMGVTELANTLGLHKSTVYRLLATLNYRGYVKKEDNSYKTGIRLLEIGSKVLDNIDLRKQVRPFLQELMQETHETIHLGIMSQLDVIYIDKEETPETIRMHSQIGRRVPAHCTSLGKVLLAYSSDEFIDKFITKKGLEPYTKKTITDEKVFKKHLEKVNKQGYSIDNEEQELGIRCIGGPIFDYNGQIIAAFSISGPTTRMTEERVNRYSKKILEYSRKISASFGYNVRLGDGR